MRIEVLITGDELLDGSTNDRNFRYVGKILSNFGLKLYRCSTIGDSKSLITSTIKEICQRSDLCIISGGLGPTTDDCTVDALASAANKDVFFNEELWEELLTYAFGSKNVAHANRRQARLFEGAESLKNEIGTAPGIKTIVDQCTVIALPGVPSEFSWMFERYVTPMIVIQKEYVTRVLRFCLVSEARLNDQITNLHLPEAINISFQALGVEHRVKLTVSVQNQHILDDAVEQIKSTLLEHYLSDHDQSLSELLLSQAISKNITLGFAESCTGGGVSASLTAIPGASKALEGSIISYSNEVKVNILGVQTQTLMDEGAVSKSCAIEMAKGALRILNCDWATSITGIAGPGGGTPDKPVGTVCFAWATNGQVEVERHLLKGSRNRIQRTATAIALLGLYRRICRHE